MPRALLLSAGLGTRLRPLTDTLPKPLVPVLGRPMICYALDLLERGGITEVTINVHHFADLLENFAKEEARRRPGLKIIIQDERAELLGSGGALKRAAPWLFEVETAALLFNADALIQADISALGRQHRILESDKGVSLTLSVMEHPDAGRRYNAFAIKEDLICEHVKADPNRQGQFFHFPGLQMVSAKVMPLLQKQPESFCIVEKIWKPMLAQNLVGAWRYQGAYLDLGTPQDVRQAEKAISSGEFKFP